MAIMGALADIKTDTTNILAILRDEEEGDEEEEGTAEEWRAYREASEARIRELRGHAETTPHHHADPPFEPRGDAAPILTPLEHPGRSSV